MIFDADLATSANMAITPIIHTVAFCTAPGSRKERTAIDAAITPIATAIPIIVPFTSLAPLVAKVISETITESAPTAAIPFTRLPSSIIPNNTETPARMAIDADMARSVAEILAICPVGAR